MMKRTLSLLLALIMVIGLVPVSVAQASNIDDIYIEEGSSVTGVSDSTTVPTEPSPTEPTQSEQENIPPVEASPVVDSSDPGKVVCDCGAESEELIRHSDGCAWKLYCIALCAGSAMDIYSQWYSLDSAERVFIKEYLSQHDQETLDTLQNIWEADQIADENDEPADEMPQQYMGEASTQVGDIVVDALGVPEGSSLTVTDASKKATDAVENAAADLGKNPEQLFLYDISVQNGESDDWQPEGDTVSMTLTIPGVKLHKYDTVYVVHVDDAGNTSTIEASVTDDGAITFNTAGFSTFAGFVVEFSYGAGYYSMAGLSELKFSKLLDDMSLPLFMSDVSNETFSDETLLSVTRLESEGDWLLTSLKPFKTDEYLTVTMNDGTEYVINVTDDTEPWIYVGGGAYEAGTRYDTGSRHNHIVSWYSDGDGVLNTQDQHQGIDGGYYGGSLAWNDGYKDPTSTIWISGNGTFQIGLKPHPSFSDRTRNYVQLQQIRAGNNVHLKVYLTDEYDGTSVEQVFLQCSGYSNLFYIEKGASLELEGRPNTELVLDAWSEELNADNTYITTNFGIPAATATNKIDNQLVRLDEGATGFKATYVRFQDAPMSAIKVRPTKENYSGMDTFEMYHCYFDGDNRRNNGVNSPATGSGGAIYFEESYNSQYTYIKNFILDDCHFDGCWAAESGGAIGLYGIISKIQIKNCTFTGTQAKRGSGGAIVMAGHASKMTLYNCTFTNCTATENGGAVYFGSRVMVKTAGTYTRLNELTIQDCKFYGTDGTDNANIGGGISLRSQTNKVSITGCTFDSVSAKTQGGGIAFGYTYLGYTADTSNFVSNSQFDAALITTQNSYTSLRTDTKTEEDGSTTTVDRYCTTLGDITMSNCDFVGTKTTETDVPNKVSQGGGMVMMTHSTLRSLSMDDVNFDGCEAVAAGSAVHMADTVVGSLSYTNSTVQNCQTTLNSAEEVGGSFRTIGRTTCAATITNVSFMNNTSHCSGGGIYWNASGVRKTAEGNDVTTAVAVSNCTFDGNKAGWYGGGIYCEAVMTVSQCELKNNVSIMMGGGIALQLYNNSVRPFSDNETTNLTLDSATNIHHNQSNVGGGISVRANATLAIDNDVAYKHTIQFVLGGAQVHHNYATTDGGGVWFNVESYNTSTAAGASNQQEVERFTKTINLNSGSVYSNIAGRNGGGIFMNGGKVTDPENTATSGLTSNGAVTINLSGAAIYDNEAGRAATGVTVTAEDVLPPVITVTKDSDGNIEFTKAGATGGNGGGIYMSGNTGVCSITGGVIGATKNADGTPGTASKNIATRDNELLVGGNGGGIAIFGQGRIEMEGGYVVNNTADTAGGGIAVHDGSSMWFHTGGVVKDNQAHMGGGISLNAAKALNASSTVDKEKYGMYLDGGMVQANIVTPDSSRGGIAYGGGICLSAGSTMKINGGEITGNKAAADAAGTSFTWTQEGGGIAVCQGSVMDISGGKIKENVAHDGGGMVIRGGSTVNMTGSITLDKDGQVSAYDGAIVDNRAERRGGGVYFPNVYSDLKLSALFEKLNLSLDASNVTAVAFSDDKLVSVTQIPDENDWILSSLKDFDAVQTLTVTMNDGTEHSLSVTDAVLFGKSTMIMDGGYIYSNECARTVATNSVGECNGGGVSVYGSGKFVLNGGRIDSNSAYNGGGILVWYGTASITNGVMSGNSARRYGGAIYNDYSNVSISGGTFHKNRSEMHAGAVFNFGTETDPFTFTVSSGEFTENTAKTDGGAICSIGATGCKTEITGGTFTSNSAASNGGAISVSGGSFSLSSGTFNTNKATQSGGGLYVSDAGITITGGDFTGNEAENGSAGGAYFGNTTGTFNTATFINNAGCLGGGLYISKSDIDFTGGTFTGNYSSQGAGIFIRSSTVDISNIEVTNNHCQQDTRFATSDTFYGGGLYIDTMDGEGSTVTIDTGDFSNNNANYGAGLWVNNNATTPSVDTVATVTINGGTFKENKAVYDGGGIWIDGSDVSSDTVATSVTMNGGILEKNTAGQNGGGIYAANRALVKVLAVGDKHGEITHNTAKNGGGVYVYSGADLYVENGFITFNNAVSPAEPETVLQTGYLRNDLYGTGGGICVLDGDSDLAQSTFTLEGTNNMAIYGNKAGFSADDVFANANNTKLQVPLVSNMNLGGYGLKPEGWFEDYNTDDDCYSSGTNMANADLSYSSERYRNASAVQRRQMHILPDYVTGNNVGEAVYVNMANAYVAMTLGIPAAVDDVVVVDFGIPVDINMWINDQFINAADFNGASFFGTERPTSAQELDGIYYSSTKPSGFTSNLTAPTAFNAWNANNGLFTFDPQVMTFSEEQKLCYVVEHNDYWYYGNVTVIPATSIYYEDNHAAVKYHTQSDTNTDNLASWDTAGTATYDPKQNQDRPGAALLEGLDADNIYGYDSSYASSVSYSNGGAHWVTVTRDKITKETTNARASFTFTGTGFDIVSLCNKNTGLVMVSVFKGEVEDFDNPPYDRCVASYMVDTHYGYGYNEETGQWELNENSATSLYQVPVIRADLTKVMVVPDDPSTPDVDECKYENYGYGTYTVEIYVAPSFLESESGYWSSDFYLDGIRIYNPAGIGDSIDQTIQQAYKDDAEAWPAYAELRNMFIEQKNLGTETTEGIIFIDGKGEDITLEDYTSWGPNNEIYLNPGEHIAFTMDMSAYGQDVSGIQLGMRGLTGQGFVRVQAGTSGSDKTTLLHSALSTTDMYYNIGKKDDNGVMIAAGKVVTISNPWYVMDADGNPVIADNGFVENTVPIAISNVKVTHGTQPSNKARIGGIFQNSMITGYIALDILSAEDLVDPIVTPERPALSFNGMISYNVFFSAENLGDLTGADLGLAVFSTEDTEGTIETAREVIYGATEIDGLYMASTGGIHAKYLGDTQYFRVFAKKADGSYVYSKMVSYSAVDYAKNTLAKSTDVKLKQLVVAMLNYGAEAQKFFNYKTDDLMNKDLTADDQALLAGYDASFLKPVSKSDPSKIGAFASTGGFSKKSPAISFKGAFEINYFFKPANAVDGDMKLYFWNEDTYNSVTELTAENADKAVIMTLENGSYTATSDEIAAKYLDRTVYVAAVYESNGITYCSGVLPYSIAAYCQKPPAGVQELATAAAIYGGTAKQYFGA